MCTLSGFDHPGEKAMSSPFGDQWQVPELFHFVPYPRAVPALPLSMLDDHHLTLPLLNILKGKRVIKPEHRETRFLQSPIKLKIYQCVNLNLAVQLSDDSACSLRLQVKRSTQSNT